MKKLKSLLLLAGMAAALNTGSVMAQDRPDPEQFRQRMMDGMRERLEVKSDDEWKIISERLEKVMTARRDAGGLAGGGMMFGRGGGPGGGRREGGGGNGGGGGGAERRGGRGGGGFFGEQPQEAKDLQSALEAKAPAEEVKAKLEKYRAYKKAKEEELKKAQASLKEVLNARQEATAVMMGMLQ